MARKLQKLINYHTSGNTSMPATGDVALGEIVVRHNDQKPELLIKKNDGSFATFIDSVAVENAISVAQTTLEGQISSLSGKVDTKFSNYYTKTEVDDNVADAKDEAIATASAYTDGEISKLDGKLSGQIATVGGNIDTVSASVKTFSASVVSNYATKDAASGYAVNAKTEAVAAAKTYTDSKVDGINSGLTADITGVEKKVDTLIGSDSGKTARSIAAEEVAKVVAEAPESYDTLKEIADWIQNDTTGAAKMANDIEELKIADGELSESIEAVDGRVTTLNNSFTAFQGAVADTYATKTGVTADIKTAKDEAIGAAKTYTDDEVSKLDSKLSEDIETVDAHVTTVSASVKTFSASVVSNYATKTGVTADIKTAKDEAIATAKTYTDDEIKEAKSALTESINTVDAHVDTVSASVKTFSASVVSNYATKTGVTADIATAKNEAIATAKTYTDGEITALNSALTADITALDGRIDTLEALTATTNSAIQKIEVSGIEGVDVLEDGTTRTLDFTDMVIDCGDF